MTAAMLPEEALVFRCGHDALLGVLHHGAPDAELAVITIVAGGPQYRGGVGRQLVFLGRELAARGVPVLRFDHRGMGDSDGAFRGFEDMEDDLQAAINALLTRLPQVRRLVLWGGCDAASAAFMNAHRFPQVIAVAAANPWINDDRMAQRVQRQHFRSRLAQWSFWKKVFTLQYNPLDYLPARRGASSNAGANTAPVARGSFVERMRDGLERFDGKLFLLMSGRSLLSRQFDELLADDPRWRTTLETRLTEVHTIADADQTFSGLAAGKEMRSTIVGWVESLRDCAPPS